MKEILFKDEARSKMLEGMSLLVDAVSCTLGPSGRNVLIRDIYKEPRITKDGITVAKAVCSSDPTVNSGIQLLRQASQKTCDDVGDGSTTVCILTKSIIDYIISNPSYKKMRPINIKQGIEAAAADMVKYIESVSVSIKNRPNLIKAIASISANNDKSVGELVYKAVVESTQDGAISVETSPVNYSYVETMMGMRFDRGMESSYFANDEFGRDCVLENCLVFLYEGKLENAMELVNVMDAAVNMKKPLLIVADSFSMDVINALAINKVQNGFKFCAIKAPSFGEQRKAIMDDLAIMLGATIVGTPKVSMDDFTEEVFGICDKATITKNDTTIMGGYGDENAIAERINQLRHETEVNIGKKQAEFRERLTKLSGGVSIIYVGSNSEAETGEIKDRVDDAVCAVRAAMKEGVVPGGGSTLIRACSNAMLNYKDKYNDKNEEFKYGYESMCLASTQPFVCIFKNGYHEDSEINGFTSYMIEMSDKFPKCGYNAKDVKFVENMVKEGIVDPTSVAKMTILNAVSIASMFLTTDCSIVDYSDMNNK